ncbi:MAG TPA: riboflavin deaminase [Cyanothece sp. UBA12306]|nr:riboflavin deaminase [Cyanothece sp. UBA12306]
MTKKRPHSTVILAMTADGKIADFKSNPARFGSQTDQEHLERQISLVDGVLFGSGTVHSYGTTLSITNSQLLADRQQQNKPLQPIHIVVSASGKINPNLRFFSQSIPRWLLTTTQGYHNWKNIDNQGFEKLMIYDNKIPQKIDFIQAFEKLKALGINKLAILGGGKLVASLLENNLIDEFWLTICPLILGGSTSVTPVQGIGFASNESKKLELLNVKQIDQEIFLHYRLHS